MKTRLTLILILFVTLTSLAQNGINYKAVIKDSNGNVVANQSVELQFIIFEGATNVYEETQSSMTDDNGIVVLSIGEGTSPNSFNSINWTSGQHFLNVQIDSGNGLIDMGTTEFKSVPYALNVTGLEALNEGNGIGWRLIGKSPNFYGTIGRNATDLSFSDTNSINYGATGSYSLAVGLATIASGDASIAMGSSTEATGSRSTALGVNTNAWGFASTALGNNTTASGNNSTAIGNLTKAEAAYSIAIGRNNIGGGNPSNWTNTDPLFEIGNGTTSNSSNALTVLKNGTITAPSLTNSLINSAGSKALITKEYIDVIVNSTLHDVYLGTGAGQYSGVGALNNVGVGARALQFNESGENNTAVGHHAMRNNANASSNTAIGSAAMGANTDGQQNTAIGHNALMLSNHNSNTAIGSGAMDSSTSGYENTAVGRSALGGNTSGHSNTSIGYSALSLVTTGNNNTGIGRGAQVPNATGSNQVRIGNNAISYAAVQVAWTITSDQRWKDKIRTLPYGLNMITALQPVDYVRKNNEHHTREIGFIAQDVKKLLLKLGYKDQGLLTTDDNGFMSLRYNDFIPVLVKAVQEQQDIIETQKSELQAVKDNYQALLSRIENLETKSSN